MPIHNYAYDRRAAALARRFRRAMTPQERKLWFLFLRDYPIKIYRQRPIGSYIVDFFCASAKLVIEIDGPLHFTAEGYAHDDQRSTILEALGLYILRFNNPDIDQRFQSVCIEIDRVIQARIKKEEPF